MVLLELVRMITVRVIILMSEPKSLSLGPRRAGSATSPRCCQVISGEEQQLWDELQGV